MDSETPTPSTCGWMIKRCVFETADAVANALANAIIDQIKSAGTTATAIMLAGGRTPKAAYNQVAVSGVTIPAFLHIAISDERHVPPDSPDSNALMMKPFLDAVACSDEQKLFIDTTLPRDRAAADFGNRLDTYFANGGTLSTCYLGLGADGHTASLFSDEDLKRCVGKSAIWVDRPDGRVGISATPTVIQKAAKIVFVVTGEDKKEMAKNLLRNPLSITAGKVVAKHPNVELWVDRDANPQLS